MAECRREFCTCTSDEKWSCLTDQWNEFDKPAEQEKQKETNQKFLKAVESGNTEEAKKLLPEITLEE